MIGSVLLAAGRGVRLRPLTDHVAKPALPLLDRPLGAFGLAALAAAAPPVLVNVSHLAATITEALDPYGDFEVLEEGPAGYGTGGTLAAIRDRVGERLVTHNADLITDLDVSALVATHESSRLPGTVAVRTVKSGADLIVEGGRATRFIDRRDRAGVAGVQFIGLAIYEKDALARIASERPVGVAETLLAELVERGELAVHVHDGYGIDVGTPLNYLRASLDLMSGKGPVLRSGWPGEIVAVEGGVAYRGPGAKVDDASLGPGAVVLAQAQVHGNARIHNAIVWPGEQLPEMQLEGAIWALGRALPIV